MMPRRVSGRPTTALEVRTRKWVERASSRPPPRAREEMALMVGMGRSERAEKVPRRLVRKSAVLFQVLMAFAHVKYYGEGRALRLGETATLLEVSAGAEARVDSASDDEGTRGTKLGGFAEDLGLLAAGAVLAVDVVDLGAQGA
jgi:hypothetical protein